MEYGFTVSFLFLTISIWQVDGKFKSLHCEAIDPNFGDIEKCEIKDINQSNNQISFTYAVKRSFRGTTTQIRLLKRANGWQPFLYDFQFDTCELIEKGKPYLANIMYAYIKSYTNLNKNCPQANFTFKVENYELDIDELSKRFPIKVGEYAIVLNMFSKTQKILSVNGSIAYSNHRE